MRLPLLMFTCLILVMGVSPHATATDLKQSAELTVVGEATSETGADLRFEVLRNGKPVGHHHVWLAELGDETRVDVRFEISVPILIIASYDYLYESSARWEGDRLMSLEAKTDDDGDVSIVKVSQVDGVTRIIGPDGELDVPGALFPTNHWNVGVLSEIRVLNTITGDVDQVTISEIGRETVATERGEIQATRYAYDGDLRTEVLYDIEDRWVGMTFEAADGSTIDYRCLRCQGEQMVTATQ